MMTYCWRLAIVCLLLAGCAIVQPGRHGDGGGTFQAGGGQD
jgi:hypothetical protein